MTYPNLGLAGKLVLYEAEILAFEFFACEPSWPDW
ncbi:MAG: hypothetical protein JWO19_526 [Bryobacterales bacterium]|jgi:hypothetical protein|nr:hypothetical protein [Bryobacterales bacterium]